MAAEQFRLAANKQDNFVSQRLLGTLGMIGSPMLLAEIALYGLLFQEAERNNQMTGVLELIYLGGWASSAFALRRLRATGNNALASIVFIIQLLGLALAAAFTVQGIIEPNPNPNSLFFKVTDAAWPLSHLFMLVVGGLALHARVWRGWRKLTPLFCGLALPAFFAASVLLPREISGLLFGVFTTVSFMLLGYAARTSEQGKLGER